MRWTGQTAMFFSFILFLFAAYPSEILLKKHAPVVDKKHVTIVDKKNGVTREYELDSKVTIEDYVKEHWKVCILSSALYSRWSPEMILLQESF